jgi:SAM-dependent methyltransferase
VLLQPKPQIVGRAVGIDLSPQMIELARRLYPGIDFREADVEHLPFSDGTLDAVVCAFGLGHFPGRKLLSHAIAEVGVSMPRDVPQGHNVAAVAAVAVAAAAQTGSNANGHQWRPPELAASSVIRFDEIGHFPICLFRHRQKKSTVCSR